MVKRGKKAYMDLTARFPYWNKPKNPKTQMLKNVFSPH
jgi:hypothetical protein